MRITLENTSKIVELNGIPARIWEGRTESGIQIHAFITRVAVRNDADCSEFERDLQETRAPSPAVAALPTKLVL